MQNSELDFSRLCKKLGYQFQDLSLLKQALTHRSAAKNHNERLEFLGDSILGMIVAQILYTQFPLEPEGKLTRMRSSLVKGDTLAELAREFDLGEYLNLGPGELKSGGFRRDSILADAVEAILGAVYLDSNIQECEKRVSSWFKQRLNALDPEYHPKDHKTQLQEYLQGKKLPLPEYKVIDIKGKSHDQTFVVECLTEELSRGLQASGASRRKAEQQAAKRVLEKLRNE